MEDEKLENLFSKVVLELEKKGYAPINIRESFDRVAPKLAWQHNWLLLFIITAAMLTGFFLPPIIVLGGLFLPDGYGYLAAALLLGSAGFLFYFSLSAFTIHEWVKSLFTFVMSLLIGAITFLSHYAALFLIEEFTSRLSGLAPLAAIPGAPTELGIVASFLPSPLGLAELLVIVLLGYNLWPFIFWVKERLESKRRVIIEKKLRV